MEYKDKLLLIKDLSARLSYGVVCSIYGDNSNGVKLCGIKSNKCYFEDLDYKETDGYVSIEGIKPYLRPMSSMNEEEKEYFYQNCLDVDVEDVRYENDGELPLPYCQKDKFIWFENIYIDDVICAIDWLNANHFDYRGLIGKGLALEAPEGMYNFK